MDFQMRECGGCTSCEMACSYRHTGDFEPSVSSIEILETKDQPGYFVRLHMGESENRHPCDGCPNEDEPFCMRYCHKKEKLQEIIKSAFQQAGIGVRK